MIEVLKQMVEALEWCHGGEPIGTAEAIKAGKQAIAELESQEPVALKKGECWPEEVMRQWDYWRKEIANGHKGSAPRDWFEGLSELKLIDTPPQRTEQEPVAWMHTKIDGVAVPHRPSDLDKHPERWEALYKTPPPCPTCEALARTVMLDQTSHDTHPPQRTWQGLTDEEVDDAARYCVKSGQSVNAAIRAIEAKLKERNL